MLGTRRASTSPGTTVSPRRRGVKLLADENFRGVIVRGLLRRRPDLDLVPVTDAGLGEADDPTILS